MKRRIAAYGLITFFLISILMIDWTSAEEFNTLKLSYKIIESSTYDQELSLTVKLRIKNTSSEPIFKALARVDSTSNVYLDRNEIYLGDINPGKTIVSSDDFTLKMNVDSSVQELPQKEVVWIVGYVDSYGNSQNVQIILR